MELLPNESDDGRRHAPNDLFSIGFLFIFPANGPGSKERQLVFVVIPRLRRALHPITQSTLGVRAPLNR